jgi:hypothetical protein
LAVEEAEAEEAAVAEALQPRTSPTPEVGLKKRLKKRPARTWEAVLLLRMPLELLRMPRIRKTLLPLLLLQTRVVLRVHISVLLLYMRPQSTIYMSLYYYVYVRILQVVVVEAVEEAVVRARSGRHMW